MKRYFLIHDNDMPSIKDHVPGFNYIALDSHGSAGHLWNLGSLDFDHVEPKPQWQPLPPVVDGVTTLAQSSIDHELLADLGISGAETTLEAVQIFGGIHPSLGL